jgi:hypothetical protein
MENKLKFFKGSSNKNSKINRSSSIGTNINKNLGSANKNAKKNNKIHNFSVGNIFYHINDNENLN